MKGATTKLAPRLVMELHPSLVLVKTGAFPFHGAVMVRGRAHECRKQVCCAVESVQNWP